MGYIVQFLVDGKVIAVDGKAMDVSVYVKNMMKNLLDNESDDSDESGSAGSRGSLLDIPIDDIPYKTLELVVLWCKHYYATHKDEIDNDYCIDETQKTGTPSGTGRGPGISIPNLDVVSSWSDNVMESYQSEISDPVIDMWDREFLDVDAPTLQSIILAANYLDIRPLLEAATKIITELFRSKTAKEILTAFNAVHTAEAATKNGTTTRTH